MLAGLFQQPLLDVQHQRRALTGEELDLVLGGLVGAQQAEPLLEAAAVHALVQDIVQAIHPLGPGGPEQTLGALPAVDVAGQHIFGVVQNGAAVVGEHDLHLRAALADQVAVVADVVHTGEGVGVGAEQLPVLFQRQHIGVGVHPGLVQLIQAHQSVAHLVGGIAQHQHELLRTHGDAPKADGEPVPGQDGENHADGFPSQLGADILGDGVHGGIVALSPGHHGLGDRNHVPIPKGEALTLGGLQDAVHHDGRQIIPLPDDGGADTSGYGADFSFHNQITSFQSG